MFTTLQKAILVFQKGKKSLKMLLFCFRFSDVTKNYRKKLEVFYQDPIEEVERKLMIASGLPNRTGATIRRLIEEEAQPDRPDK